MKTELSLPLPLTEAAEQLAQKLGIPLTELDAVESIVNAVAIYKTIRSHNPYRQQTREYLHIIQSTNLEGLMVYTKGKLVQEAGIETYYFLISSKKAI
jgi:hypothetical protein